MRYFVLLASQAFFVVVGVAIYLTLTDKVAALTYNRHTHHSRVIITGDTKWWFRRSDAKTRTASFILQVVYLGAKRGKRFSRERVLQSFCNWFTWMLNGARVAGQETAVQLVDVLAREADVAASLYKYRSCA